MESLFSLYNRDEFLKRLLTFRSTDKVQREIFNSGINITLENVRKIGMMVCDLEKNEESFSEEDLDIIFNADNYVDGNSFFNPDLYDLFYNKKATYPRDFFLNEKYYDGEAISTGLFSMACKIFKLKKKYLKTEGIWDMGVCK